MNHEVLEDLISKLENAGNDIRTIANIILIYLISGIAFGLVAFYLSSYIFILIIGVIIFFVLTIIMIIKLFDISNLFSSISSYNFQSASIADDSHSLFKYDEYYTNEGVIKVFSTDNSKGKPAFKDGELLKDGVYPFYAYLKYGDINKQLIKGEIVIIDAKIRFNLK
jgi:hypothetical protein